MDQRDIREWTREAFHRSGLVGAEVDDWLDELELRRVKPLARAAAKAAYEGDMPDSGIRADLLAAIDEALR